MPDTNLTVNTGSEAQSWPAKLPSSPVLRPQNNPAHPRKLAARPNRSPPPRPRRGQQQPPKLHIPEHPPTAKRPPLAPPQPAQRPHPPGGADRQRKGGHQRRRRRERDGACGEQGFDGDGRVRGERGRGQGGWRRERGGRAAREGRGDAQRSARRSSENGREEKAGGCRRAARTRLPAPARAAATQATLRGVSRRCCRSGKWNAAQIFSLAANGRSATSSNAVLSAPDVCWGAASDTERHFSPVESRRCAGHAARCAVCLCRTAGRRDSGPVCSVSAAAAAARTPVSLFAERLHIYTL